MCGLSGTWGGWLTLSLQTGLLRCLLVEVEVLLDLCAVVMVSLREVLDRALLNEFLSVL